LALAGMPTSNVEFLVKGSNGRSTPVLVSAAPVIGADGTIIGAVIVAQDIAVVKELEREREEWISIVAHDLRQPITTIAGYAQLLARQAEPGALQLRKSAENIAASARQLNRMIADLLDISRIDTAHLTLEKQAIDLSGFLRGVTERVGEALLDHRIVLTVAMNLPPVEADPGRLEQVLTNLLTNAAKYGDRNAAIQVTAQRRDNGVEIAVTNRGPGIPAESLPHLFDRFYRGRRARESKVGGLGVGLYITSGLIAAHGGKLRVASTPGEETTFAFTLPVASEARETGPNPQPLPDAGRGVYLVAADSNRVLKA
ncbi:MAG TPA: ATP-binding protein, partial [Chloroflexota bacterium]|nr:ATP-binding protein [Chloroflexota bacterium]